MIAFIPSEKDDLAFLSLVQRIVNGAVETLRMHEVYLVHVDNWFDWKWLGWRGRRGKELSVPPSDPNRVLSEGRFVRDADGSRWASVDLQKPLHLRQPGRSWLAQPLARFSESAAFIWYSGNSVTNRAGSLMLYLSGADDYAWYASFVKDDHWKIHRERQITRNELIAFEDCGRRIVTD